MPVGRAASRGNQEEAPLETLIGRGDFAAIARRVQEGKVNLADLPPNVRSQVVRFLNPTAKREEDGGPSDADKAVGAFKQVLSLAKQLVGNGPGAKAIDQMAATTSPEGQSALDQQRAGERGPAPTAPAVPNAPAQAPNAPAMPGQPTDTPQARLEALGFTPTQIQQILTETGGATGTANLNTGTGGENFQIPLVGEGKVLFQDPQGNSVSDPGLDALISSGQIRVEDAIALANQGFSPPEIEQILGGAEAIGAGAAGAATSVPDTGMLPPGAGPAALSGLGGALSIYQALTNDKMTDLQKGIATGGAALQTGAQVANAISTASAAASAGEAAAGGSVGAAEGATTAATGNPYLGTILGGIVGLTNVGLTAAGEGSDEYKAAAAAVDLAAGLLSGVTFGISSMVAPSIKQALYKAFYDMPHDVREARELATVGGTGKQFISEIQAAKSLPELYRTLQTWQSGAVGGATGRDTQSGHDPVAFNIYAAPNQGRPEWNYLGLYKDGAFDPNGPAPDDFFQRLAEHPEDFRVATQAGIGPEDQGVPATGINRTEPLDRAIMANIQEQIAEIKAREQIRPNVMGFSKLAGVYVSEDDVVDALRKAGVAGVQMDSPDFPNYLKQAERARVTKAATDEAMGAQPYLTRGLPNSPYDPTAGLRVPDHSEEALLEIPVKNARGTGGDRQIELPDTGLTYLPATAAGLTFQPGVGWVDGTGNVLVPTAALPAPVAFQAPVAQPASTATPPSAPAPSATTGQSAVPPGSPLAPDPNEQPPIGVMDGGGVVPETGNYQLEEGETVLPNPNSPGTTILPSGQIRPDSFAPNPMVRQTLEHAANLLAPQAPTYPDGRYYLNPKRGIPYQSKKNPNGRDWRLIFNPGEYHQAWQDREKDGPPLLVPASVLERADWPNVVQSAQASQYQTVHPAILLARANAPDALDQPVVDLPFLQPERLDLRMMPGPTPKPEATPPMREMPKGRPMSPEEIQELNDEEEVARG